VKNLANLLLTAVVLIAVWGFYFRFHHHMTHPASPALPLQQNQDASGADRSGARQPPFRCDGRTYCSQMTSCAEAKYFLANCPAVNMDGDHDGIPCESQWCPNG